MDLYLMKKMAIQLPTCVLLSTLSNGLAFSQESHHAAIDAKMKQMSYDVIIDMACLDSDYRRLLGQNDSQCEVTAETRLLECKKLLGPLLPEFGLIERMSAGEQYNEQVTSASLSLIYCIQARSIFEPQLQTAGHSSTEVASGNGPNGDSDLDAIRTSIRALPVANVYGLFELAMSSDYVMVSMVGDKIVAAQENKEGRLVSTIPSDQSLWRLLMSETRTGSVLREEDSVFLILEVMHEIHGVPVQVQLSNKRRTTTDECTDTTLAPSVGDGVCRIDEPPYLGVEIWWYSNDDKFE